MKIEAILNVAAGPSLVVVNPVQVRRHAQALLTSVSGAGPVTVHTLIAGLPGLGQPQRVIILDVGFEA